MTKPTGCNHCVSFKKAGLHLASEDKVANMSQMKQPRHFKKNEIIFSQGETLSHVYCLRSGLVKLETVGEEGRTQAMGFISGGSILGFGLVLSKLPSNITAVALEDTYACAVSAELFTDIVAKTPDLAMMYLSDMFKELRSTQSRLLNGVDKDVASRVAEALVYLKNSFPDHNFTRKEIAEWAGTSTESVIRTLSTFEDEGLITQQGRHIHITDPSRLNSTAGAII
jgi:CRP-like cAMP-binding protein